MKKYIHLGLSVALPLTLLAGCKTAVAPMPDATVAEVSAFQKPASLFTAASKVMSSIPANGLANVRASLRVLESPFPGFKVLALPTSWTKATVSLFSESVNAPYNADTNTRSVDFADFNYSSGEASVTDFTLTGEATSFTAFDLAMDNKGNAYISDNTGNRILKVASDGQTTVLADSSKVSAPFGIAVDPDQNVFFTESSGAIRRIDAVTGAVSQVTILAGGPLGLAVGADGFIYVALINTNQIVKVDPDAGGSVPYGTAASPAFAAPIDVAIDGDGNLYVADLANSMIRKIAAGDGEVTQVGADAVPAISTPRGVTVDSAGNVYATDYGNSRLIKISAAGAVTPFEGPETSLVQDARGIAVDGDGKVTFVANTSVLRHAVAGAPNYRAGFQFPPLRPSSDYEARVYLTTEGGKQIKLAGSQVLPTFALKSGANELVFDVVVNGDVLNFKVTESATGNKIEDNLITEGDVVTLATGLAKNQPGVSKVLVLLDGKCYQGGAPALLGVLEDPDTWDTFTWDTNQPTKGSEGYNGFNTKRFQGAFPQEGDVNQYPTERGRLRFVALNDRNETVGDVDVQIGVFGRPQVDVILQ